MADEYLRFQRAEGNYIAQANNNATANVNITNFNMSHLTPRQQQDRAHFLDWLHRRYDQEWEQSLQGAARVTLGLKEQPDAVLHHIGLLFRTPQQPERLLPEGTTIAQVFEEVGHELLILGEPGAGKSMLLLELARYLVERAEHDDRVPMPVIIPLSSWAVKRLPLISWLREQLVQLYKVPHELSAEWMQTNQILPLLDGLDEVPRDVRLACIKAINRYRKEHMVPLVVCSRQTEYEEIEQQHRLGLSSSVVVQPLNKERVWTYLRRAGLKLHTVQATLRINPVLQELVTIPLMLNVITLTYAGTSDQALPNQGTLEEQQRRIFAAYIERMVAQKGDTARYPLQRTQSWLSWLARQMRDHHQSVFSLEQLQPDWLPKTQRTFYKLSVRLVGGLIGGILLGILFYALLVILQYSDNAQEAGIFWGFLPGLIGGFFWGFFPGSLGRTIWRFFSGLIGRVIWGRMPQTRRKFMDIPAWLEKGLYSWIFSGIFVTPFYAICTWQSNFAFYSINNTIAYLLIVLVVEVASGLCGGWIAALVYGNEADMRIVLTEVLTWTWRRLGSGLIEGLRDVLLLAIILGLTFTSTFILASKLWNPSRITLMNVLIVLLATIIASVLLGMLLGALFGGFSGKQLTEDLSLSPNEGIWRSAKHGAIVGVISAVVGCIVSALIVIFVSVLAGIMVSASMSSLEHNWLSALPNVLGSGAVVVGALGALSGGWAAIIRHYLLRFWLWQTGMFPSRIVHFLDDATSRILLRRVGGGYSFAHQLILNYFASLDNAPVGNASTPSEHSPLSSALLICEACGYQDIPPKARFCPQCGNPCVPNECK
ncbi:MAG: NACHT domain-containing protein [Chloroflexota bacterium]|nr:NACHT domain-containing protein [Chloroflexota bacterium]